MSDLGNGGGSNHADIVLANLAATEEALAAATDDIEYVRAKLRDQINHWRGRGMSWAAIKTSPVWDAFKRIGGS